jgi:glycosyltransferase involved in cell wall biosynthesis
MKTKPIVHAFFLTYNEANILPHLLRYYSTFCEQITIMDNGPTDDTVKIAESFENVDVIPFESNEEFNDLVHIKLKNNVWKSSVGYADYVILGDADEFLYHENMIKFLIDAKEKGFTLFKPEGYHMVASEDFKLNADDNIFELVKKGVRTPILDKPMMFNCNKLSNINYGFGCHSASPTGEVVLSTDPSLKMLHFKFLGLENYHYKNNLRKKRLSEFNKTNNFGTYYLFDDEEHTKDYRRYVDKSEVVLK